MAKTPSNMVSLGTKAPDFNLPDVTSDSYVNLNDLKGLKGTLIMFICNHCPYVKHVNNTIVNLANIYQPKEVNFIAISSNDVINYPEDSPELMKKMLSNIILAFRICTIKHKILLKNMMQHVLQISIYMIVI